MYLLPDPRLVRLTSTTKVEDGLIEVTVWAVTMMPGLEGRYSNVIYSGMISPLPTKYYNSEQKVPLLTLSIQRGWRGWGRLVGEGYVLTRCQCYIRPSDFAP